MVSRVSDDITAGTVPESNSQPESIVEGETPALFKKNGEVACFMFIVPEDPEREDLLYMVVKRMADVVLALMALVILSPLMLLVAFLIWLEDRGPIFYSHWRVGRYGAPIRFHKFRSMRVGADKLREKMRALNETEGAAFKMKDDPRITRVGKVIRKLSIDELPQIFSVLVGDMTVIGPRPLTLQVGYACRSEQLSRYYVTPGLACLREIGGRSKLSFDRWMELDAEYVCKRSLLFDLSILARLLPAVLKGDGAY